MYTTDSTELLCKMRSMDKMILLITCKQRKHQNRDGEPQDLEPNEATQASLSEFSAGYHYPLHMPCTSRTLLCNLRVFACLDCALKLLLAWMEV